MRFISRVISRHYSTFYNSDVALLDLQIAGKCLVKHTNYYHDVVRSSMACNDARLQGRNHS